MKKLRNFISISIILFIVICSCKKTESSSTSLTGTLKGTITLQDDFGTDITDKSGTTISVIDSVTLLSAVTDIDGNYQIDNLPTGRYDISFSKTGYGDKFVHNYVFVGGLYPQIRSTNLTKISTTLVTDLAVTVSSGTSMTINCTISPEIPAGKYRDIIFFLGNNSSVTSTNYLEIIRWGTNTNTFSRDFTINKTIFPSGTTLYAIAYGEAKYGYVAIDIESGLLIHSTINPTGSNVASITVP